MVKKKDTPPPKKPKPVPLEKQEAELTKAAWPQFEGLGLTLQQQRFVICYCRPDIAFNGTRAYIEAYDLEVIDDYLTAQASASRLLRNVKVQRAISVELDRQLNDHDGLARRVMGEWQKLAFFDVAEMLGFSGPFVTLKSLEELPVHFRPAIKSIENTQMGIKITFHDKQKALESIAKCLGMFQEIVKDVGETYETMVERLARKEREAQEAGK